MTEESKSQQSNSAAKTSTPGFGKPNWKKWAWDNFVSLGSALLLVLVIRSSVIEAFKIPSGSMIPTLLVGDQIFVNKFSYGLRIPFTDWVGEKPRYFFRTNEPARGDIIVFKYPVDPDIYFIKRIVGIPGDTIEMKNKVVTINGKEFEKTPLAAEKIDGIFKSLEDSASEYPRERMDVHYEKFDNDTATIMVDKQSYFSESFSPVVVPEGQYFVMGDNRDNSKDSRFWGFVPFDYVKGKAFVIWLSVWIDLDQSQFTFRPERIGNLLH
jgi:signal peptidase I